MNKKLSSQASDSIKHTSEKLPAEFSELSEEDLQQIVGGRPFFRTLTKVIKGHSGAVSDTVNGLVGGKLPNKETAEKVFVPLDWQLIHELFF
jgi:bacteriocin-like protein